MKVVHIPVISFTIEEKKTIYNMSDFLTRLDDNSFHALWDDVEAYCKDNCEDIIDLDDFRRFMETLAHYIYTRSTLLKAD